MQVRRPDFGRGECLCFSLSTYAARFDVQHPFDEIDLLDIGESVKHMNIVVVAQAFLFKMKGRVSRARDPVLAQVRCPHARVCIVVVSLSDLALVFVRWRRIGILSSLDCQIRRVLGVDSEQQTGTVELRRDVLVFAERALATGQCVGRSIVFMERFRNVREHKRTNER